MVINHHYTSIYTYHNYTALLRALFLSVYFLNFIKFPIDAKLDLNITMANTRKIDNDLLPNKIVVRENLCDDNLFNSNDDDLCRF